MKSTVLKVCSVVAAVVIFSCSFQWSGAGAHASAHSQEDQSRAGKTREDKTLSPYFFVQGDPDVDRLPLKDTHVQIDVSGVIADVTGHCRHIEMKARGRSMRAMFFRRPLAPPSTRCACGSAIRSSSPRSKSGTEAKQEFEKAKSEGKSASLLEQNRPNVFSMSLANVMPGDQIEIELRYTELLAADGRHI